MGDLSLWFSMIGIHDSPGSFSDRWFEWCLQNGVPFKRLDCLSSDILQQCAELEAVLWHWTFVSLPETLVARQILTALEQSGLVVFPTAATCWHYDDKVGQKYLLESIGAPLIPTWVFTSQDKAAEWIANTSFPKVFKLRCGASSENVRLVQSREEATAICQYAFRNGFSAKPSYLHDAKTRLRQIKDWRDFFKKLKRMPSSVMATLQQRRCTPRERGYVYFQEFLPGNEFDTRVTIIGNRAFGVVRRNRPNDFRASGSGLPVFDPERIDRRCIESAFQVSEKLDSQSLACDFLMDAKNEPRISEISYCFVPWTVHDCPGYWDRECRWQEGHFWPQDCILQDLLARVSNQTQEFVAASS